MSLNKFLWQLGVLLAERNPVGMYAPIAYLQPISFKSIIGPYRVLSAGNTLLTSMSSVVSSGKPPQLNIK